MPRIAIISDIHANLEALEAVLRDLERKRAQKIYCLGDIIGYGPSPVEVADIVEAVSSETVRGNHEDLVTRPVPDDDVHPDALKAADWTRRKLSPGPGSPERKRARWEWLKALPATEDLGQILLAHGTPSDTCTYVLDRDDARRVLRSEMGEARLCFIGHTHVPGVWSYDGQRVAFREAERKRRYALRGRKLLVNVGSVGQPRDRDPRASYVLVHSDLSFEFRRVEYDVEKTAGKIFAIKDLPNWLGERLLCGE